MLGMRMLESGDVMFQMVAHRSSHIQPLQENVWSSWPTGMAVSVFRASKWLMFSWREVGKSSGTEGYFSDFWTARVSTCLPATNSCPSCTMGENVPPWCGNRWLGEGICILYAKRRKEDPEHRKKNDVNLTCTLGANIQAGGKSCADSKRIVITSHWAEVRSVSQPTEFVGFVVRSTKS